MAKGYFRGSVDPDGSTRLTVFRSNDTWDFLGLTPVGRKHSPTGFGWGYMGSGPSATAHAILNELCGKRVADSLYMQFKNDVIADLEFGKDFKLTYSSIRLWIKRQQS